MRALVTGSSGNMGPVFCDALEARGYEVTGIDLSKQHIERFFMDDRTRWDLVVHCAQALSSDPKEKRWDSWAARNATMDAALWSWASRTVQNKIIYPSSADVYGESCLWARETDPVNPTGVIGKIKAHGEMLGRLTAAGDAQYLFPRYFDVFSKQGLSKALDCKDVIKELRWANRYSYPSSGEELRDFIYVKDAVEITLKILEAGRSGPINICSGVGVKYSDFTDLVINKIARPGAEVVFDKDKTLPSQVGYNGVMLRYARQEYTLEAAMEDIRDSV